MKEIVISLLEDNEPARVSTYNLVKDSLRTLSDNNIISFQTRDKTDYTNDEKKVCASVYVKLEDCSDKFKGAFEMEFAYKTSGCVKIDDNTYRLFSGCWDVCLETIRRLTTMMWRISDLDGFSGKIYLKIDDLREFPGTDKCDVEPIPKHSKYFGQYTEFSKYDF